MSSDGSVSRLLGPLKDGDRTVVEKLWARYCQIVVTLARKRLRNYPGLDAEDVTLSAFDSFIRAAERGRFARLEDRHDLWRLLATITVRKACRHLRNECRTNGHQVTGSITQSMGDDLDYVADRASSPDVAVQMAEDAQRLLNCLPNTELQSIAVWKLEGYTNRAIAAKLDCSSRTIERRIGLIRASWKEFASQPEDSN